ncbi:MULTISPECIES: ABC transporter ATP-binding protein/permease [Spongiibacter]|uniref:ABC transporter ATP-binding protein/permease n=1 Tax=Spongiibacter TaxID=630749 RepID=UPI000C4BA2F2|nr:MULTISPECIES: ATP-binding cassette domain-containing protein [Spongiibacter]MAY38186.1 ABC transporter ATP-binding protein [Spongiibacter sp.]|tara:strand:- start:52468 stop:54153 length:1686 start_codon:yes stop_codon:yes gene_type:complete
MAAELARDKRELAAWLRTEGKRFRRRVSGVVGLSMVATIAQVAALFLLATLAQQWVIDGQRASPGLLLGLGSALVVQLLFQRLRERFRSGLADCVQTHYQSALRRRLDERSLALIRDYSVASWQSFFTRRVSALQLYFCDYVPQTLLAVLVPLLVLVIVLPFSWLVALTLLVTAPLVPLFMWLVGMGAAVAHREHFVAIERLTGLFLDRLRARQLLQIFNRVGAERAFFNDASTNLKQRTLNVVSLAFLSSSVLDFFTTLSIALVAVFVGFSLLGEISFGHWSSGLSLRDGLFMLLLAPLFFSELRLLGRHYHSKAEALGAADELQSILDLPPLAVMPRGLPLTLPPFKVLASDAGHSILSVPGLTLGNGARILLSGASGSGKTSLLEALLGQRPVRSDTRMSRLERGDVAWLDQSPPVLPGSIRENLALGQPLDDARLLAALDDVGLGEWLSQQSQGLDTLMGDYPPLSGGQRQRLAIARLVLQQASVAFLDEPTAHLAPEQREAITVLLQRQLADRTVVWIAHGQTMNDFFTEQWQIIDGDLVLGKPPVLDARRGDDAH